MIKCHIVYLLLRIKSPIAYSASDFSIHLLLNHLGATTDHNEDEDKAGDHPSHYFYHHNFYENSLVDAVITIS